MVNTNLDTPNKRILLYGKSYSLATPGVI